VQLPHVPIHYVARSIPFEVVDAEILVSLSFRVPKHGGLDSLNL